MGALVRGTLLSVSLFPCNINAEVFCAWATQDLLPKLPASNAVVMDLCPLGITPPSTSGKALKAAPAMPDFLPTYPPGLNPIEHKWVQLKSIRNKWRCPVDRFFTEAMTISIYTSFATI
jgi:transposase